MSQLFLLNLLLVEYMKFLFLEKYGSYIMY